VSIVLSQFLGFWVGVSDENVRIHSRSGNGFVFAFVWKRLSQNLNLALSEYQYSLLTERFDEMRKK